MKIPPSLRSVWHLLWVAGSFCVCLPATAADAAKPVPLNQDGTPKIPAELLMMDVKATPYSGRAALKEKLRQGEVKFDTRLPEWEARCNALPEKERKAAAADLKELKRMREVLRDKLDQLDAASVETWNSVKYDLYVAMLNAVSTYKKLQYQLED
jgi:hypothetical protein